MKLTRAHVCVGLGGLGGTVVGGGDVATGDWLADGGLTVGEGGPLHAVTGGGTKSCSLWPACTAASTRAVNQVVAEGCVGLGVGGETHWSAWTAASACVCTGRSGCTALSAAAAAHRTRRLKREGEGLGLGPGR